VWADFRVRIKKIRFVLRCFIAINLTGTVKSLLADIQDELRKCKADIRWVNPSNIHLTLKFLGNIKEERVDDIIRVLEAGCRSANPFVLKIKGLGMFPHTMSPRVLWVGITGGSGLFDLRKEIEDGMVSAGFEADNRSFKPHLTIGRFKSRAGRECLQEIMRKHETEEYTSMHVKSVALMRSDLLPEGAMHSKIADVPLGVPG
jgi:2'-5' RNA ligase